jgi:hypothetical protein
LLRSDGERSPRDRWVDVGNFDAHDVGMLEVADRERYRMSVMTAQQAKRRKHTTIAVDVHFEVVSLCAYLAMVETGCA